MSADSDPVGSRGKSRWFLVLVAVGALVLAGVGYWLWPRAGDAEQLEANDRGERGRGSTPGSLTDPKPTKPGGSHLARAPGVIVGTVTELDGAPLGSAQVCARVGRGRAAAAPRCTETSGEGHYRLEDLAPGPLEVFASAAEHQPQTATLTLAGGAEQRVDLELLPGGVLIRGVVHDLAGGEIEGALVVIAGDAVVGDPSARALAVSDAEGQFRAWVRRGRIHVHARAQGYAARSIYSAAPGPTLAVYLVPEAVLVGRVVDADTGAPVAEVEIEPGLGGGGAFMTYTVTSAGWARSDSEGYFRVEGLSPGAFRPYVASGHWRGRAAQTVNLGLGETSAMIELPVTRAATVRARVVADPGGAPACTGGHASVSPAPFEIYSETIDERGWVEFGGLAPGDYDVSLHCSGRLLTDAASFTIGPDAADLDDLRWTVARGFDVRGTIVDGDGRGLPGLVVLAELLAADDDERGPTARRSRAEPSDKTGAFVLVGLEPGSYELVLGGSSGPSLAAAVELELRAADLDGLRLEVPIAGELIGRVVDEGGLPVADITVTAYGAGGAWLDTRSDDQGGFELAKLGPDRYRVVAFDGRWSLERGELTVELEEGGRAQVELIAALGQGSIRGRVVDEAGTALDDAFISVERQPSPLDAPPQRGRLSYSDAKGRPVLSETDGSFAIGALPKGLYTVRAQQKQGGEAIVSDVQVGSRGAARVELVIEAFGSLAGVVEGAKLGGTELVDFAITARLADRSFEARDRWINRDGRWALAGLPPGSYELIVESHAGDARTVVELPAGAAINDLRVELEGRVSLRGRLLDGRDQRPIAGARVRVSSASDALSGPGQIDWVRSDAQGWFRLDVPVGEHELTVVPSGSAAGRSHQGLTQTIAVPAEPKTYELGDLQLSPS